MQDAIKIRRGATAHIKNAVVKGNGAIENIIDLTDSKGDAGTGTEIGATNEASNLTSDAIKAKAEYPGVKIASGNNGCPTDGFGWTGYSL